MFGFRSAFLLVLIVFTQSQCAKWTLDNGETLDLSCLVGHTFNAIDGQDPPHDYIFHIGNNGLSHLYFRKLQFTYSRNTYSGWVTCGDNGDGYGDFVFVEGMAVQTSRVYAEECYYLGMWDQSIMPTYSDADGGTWTFRYDNGYFGCGNAGRTWAPTFVCSPGTIAEIGTVSETPPCYYELTIKTQYACKDQSYTTCACDDVYTVKVVNALDLPDTDVSSKVDPYVEVYAYEDNGRFQKVSTTVKENNDAPVWNEEFKFDSKRIGNSSYTAFRFKVWDDDKILGSGGADFLGESEYFYTENVVDCNYVYAKQFYIDQGDFKGAKLYVEVSKECYDAN